MLRITDGVKASALLLGLLIAQSTAQLLKKPPIHRASSSNSNKFSLNPLKPLMKFMRNQQQQDPMKAAAQRHYPKYLPPPPGMGYQRAAASVPYAVGMHPYRPYPAPYARVLPPSTMSLMPYQHAYAPPMPAMFSDHHHAYRPLSSDIQYKAVRIPSKHRRPAADTLNIADSVVRQLLDISNQQHQHDSGSNSPSVLVIEDPDVTSSQTSDVLDAFSHQHGSKVVLAPPVHAEYASASDTSTAVDSNGMSESGSNNPEVFVIVSKNKSKSGSGNGSSSYYSLDDKKSDILSSSSSPKLKKYKITSTYDENGGRQVWIIK